MHKLIVRMCSFPEQTLPLGHFAPVLLSFFRFQLNFVFPLVVVEL